MIDSVFECLKNDGAGFNRLSTMNQIKVQMFLLFMSIAMQRYKYKGLPKEMPSWCVEKVINLYGQGVIFKVGDEYLCTSAVNSASLNIYGEPCEVQPIALNGMSFDRVKVKDTMEKVGSEIVRGKQNAVLIKNNVYSIPTYALIKPYIERLCFIWESSGINAGLSRVVALIHCNKDIANTVRAEVGKIMGGSKTGLAIVNEKSNILESIEKVDLKVNYEPNKYWEDFDNTFNLICEILGITTDMNKAKKERVVVAQVESNDEMTTTIQDSYLYFRELACEELKEVFGLSVMVEDKTEEVKVTNPNDYKTNLDTENMPTM